MKRAEDGAATARRVYALTLSMDLSMTRGPVEPELPALGTP
jgi:hypothetical protein